MTVTGQGFLTVHFSSLVQGNDKDSPMQLKETSWRQKREQPSPLILFMSSHSSPWLLQNRYRRERYHISFKTTMETFPTPQPWTFREASGSALPLCESLFLHHQNQMPKRCKFVRFYYVCFWWQIEFLLRTHSLKSCQLRQHVRCESQMDGWVNKWMNRLHCIVSGKCHCCFRVVSFRQFWRF